MAAQQTTQLKISGMGCASCVGRVEAALREVQGVSEASVNFATETAQVTYDGQVSGLINALSHAGYPAATRQTTLKIAGMSCASCVSKIERALKADPQWSTLRSIWPRKVRKSPMSTARPIRRCWRNTAKRPGIRRVWQKLPIPRRIRAKPKKPTR